MGGARAAASQGADHVDAGLYRVDFNRDVSGCYAAATINGNASGQIAAETKPGPSEAKSVYVYTRATAGNLSDRAFHLIVTC